MIVQVVDQLRLAIVGLGRMGSYHARTLVTSDHVDVLAVADTDRQAAAVLAGEIGAAPVASLAELARRDDIEAWLVATPTLTHPEIVETALAAGMHVLCEKPLALDPAVGRRVGSAAIEAGLVLQIGFWRRFAPPWASAKSLVAAGAIGRPLLLRLSQWDADPPPAQFCDPVSSGGLAIDCGVHEYDLAEWLTGQRIERVTAHTLPLVDPSLAEVGDVDNLLAVLELTDGAVATVDLSRNCRYGDDVRTEVLGEDGAIFVDLLPTSRTRLATADRIEVVAGSTTEDAFFAGVLAQAEAFAAAVRGANGDVPLAEASTRAVIVGRMVQSAAGGSGQVVADGDA